MTGKGAVNLSRNFDLPVNLHPVFPGSWFDRIISSPKQVKAEMSRYFLLGTLSLLLGGCASYGKIENLPQQADRDTTPYSLRAFSERWKTDPNALMLSFSGGGTRAAALSYGVLRELRDTRIEGPSGEERLLDEVHSISSVSGGSFTAAYYGLHGDRIFEDYEQVFLRQDVQSVLFNRLMNPLHWFSDIGRTEMAIEYYEEAVFKGATFADMRLDGPMILINTADFARGVRFSFIQEYFDLLCSDLSSFPVARAVAASSAVPVVFNPVVIENFDDCAAKDRAWLDAVREDIKDKPDLQLTLQGLESYSDPELRRYIHFVDGGIVDNLGMRALYEIIELYGGITQFSERIERTPPRRLVLISVNAATDPQSVMDQTTEQPSIAQSVNAMSDVQLRRYSADTVALIKGYMKHWAETISTPERKVESYFIVLDFDAIEAPERRDFLNRIPTSFALTEEQVEVLIATGGELLRSHPEFIRLLQDIAAETN